MKIFKSLKFIWQYTNPSMMYKPITNWSIQIYSWSFLNNKRNCYTRGNIHDTHQFHVFQTHIPTLNIYGLNSISYKANQLWNLLPKNLKSFLSLKQLWEYHLRHLWGCIDYYVPNLGYYLLSNWFFPAFLPIVDTDLSLVLVNIS